MQKWPLIVFQTTMRKPTVWVLLGDDKFQIAPARLPVLWICGDFEGFEKAPSRSGVVKVHTGARVIGATSAPCAVGILHRDEKIGGTISGGPKDLSSSLTKSPAPAKKHLTGVEHSRRGSEGGRTSLHRAVVHLYLCFPLRHPNRPVGILIRACESRIVEKSRNNVSRRLRIRVEPTS